MYRLLTDPSLFPEWWGPQADCAIEVVEMDLRVGGRWRMNNIDDDGNVYEFQGEYLELTPPSTIRQTFQFMGFPDAISTEHLTLTERDGGTLLRVVADYGSPEGAAGAIGSGMEQGASRPTTASRSSSSASSRGTIYLRWIQ